MTVCQGTRGQTNFGECVFYLALEHAYKRNSSFLLNYALAGAQTKTHMNIIQNKIKEGGISISLSDKYFELYNRNQSDNRDWNEFVAAKKAEAIDEIETKHGSDKAAKMSDVYR